jgi:hypothetical protein
VSNFFHYFSYNFEKLGLKKLITTCYKNQSRDLFSDNQSEVAIYLEYNGDKNGDNVPNVEEIGVHTLNGDGDFRSYESITLLKGADIVVTNPPFSLFREYLAQLVAYDKKFVIVGHQNALTYKEIFPLIKENKLWLGYGFKGGASHFINTHYEDYATATDRKEGMIRVSGVVWFTNLEIKKRHEDLPLYKTYFGNESEYPKYDNYDAINVDKTKDIPMDYTGIMGVPITFMDKYNPEQFEILGSDAYDGTPPIKTYPKKLKVVDSKKMKSQTGTMGCVIKEENFGAGTYFDVGYPVRAVYKRLFIRNKRL